MLACWFGSTFGLPCRLTLSCGAWGRKKRRVTESLVNIRSVYNVTWYSFPPLSKGIHSKKCYLAAALLLSGKSHALTRFDTDLTWKGLAQIGEGVGAYVREILLKVEDERGRDVFFFFLLSRSPVPVLHDGGYKTRLLADVTGGVRLAWVWELCGLPLPLFVWAHAALRGRQSAETGWHMFGHQPGRNADGC